MSYLSEMPDIYRISIGILFLAGGVGTILIQFIGSRRRARTQASAEHEADASDDARRTLLKPANDDAPCTVGHAEPASPIHSTAAGTAAHESGSDGSRPQSILDNALKAFARPRKIEPGGPPHPSRIP